MNKSLPTTTLVLEDGTEIKRKARKCDNEGENATVFYFDKGNEEKLVLKLTKRNEKSESEYFFLYLVTLVSDNLKRDLLTRYFPKLIDAKIIVEGQKLRDDTFAIVEEYMGVSLKELAEKQPGKFLEHFGSMTLALSEMRDDLEKIQLWPKDFSVGNVCWNMRTKTLHLIDNQMGFWKDDSNERLVDVVGELFHFYTITLADVENPPNKDYLALTFRCSQRLKALFPEFAVQADAFNPVELIKLSQPEPLSQPEASKKRKTPEVPKKIPEPKKTKAPSTDFEIPMSKALVDPKPLLSDSKETRISIVNKDLEVRTRFMNDITVDTGGCQNGIHSFVRNKDLKTGECNPNLFDDIIVGYRNLFKSYTLIKEYFKCLRDFLFGLADSYISDPKVKMKYMRELWEVREEPSEWNQTIVNTYIDLGKFMMWLNRNSPGCVMNAYLTGGEKAKLIIWREIKALDKDKRITFTQSQSSQSQPK